jgi:cytochrome c5
MSDPHNNPVKSKLQGAIALLGGLLAPVLVIYLLVKPPAAPEAPAQAASEAKTAEVEERIAPVAEVEVEEAGEASEGEAAGDTNTAMSAADVVKNSCAMCHASGAMGAPKVGDKATWEPRIAQGYETLVEHAIKGIRMMPPKGGNANLSDEDVAKAVVLMANESGANFTSPE